MWEKIKSWNWHLIIDFIVKGGEVAAVLLIFVHFWHSAETNIKYALVVLGIAILALLLINLFLTIQINRQKARWIDEKISLEKNHSEALKKFERNSRFVEVLPNINKAFSVLHELYRNESATKKDFITELDKFCTKLALAYKKITGADCSVCIKVNNNPPTHEINKQNPMFSYRAFDLSRDSLTEGREYKDDIEHWYKDNTDFEVIFKNIKADKGKFFLSNSLPGMLIYHNTSFQRYEFDAKGFPPNTSLSEKINNWPLKYRSTMVAPICPSIADHRNKEKLLGFLCVDSFEMDIFDERHDPELLIGCADGMWNVLLKFLQKFPTQ